MKKKTRKYKRYKFDMHDYAYLFGVTYGTVRNYAAQGKFNPYDIRSVCEFYYSLKKNKG